MREEHSENTGFIKTIEPVTTVLEEEKILRIRSELPGIAEEKIRIDLDKTQLPFGLRMTRISIKK